MNEEAELRRAGHAFNKLLGPGRHLQLDQSSPKARRASELARELAGARLAGPEVSASVFGDAIAEVASDLELFSYLVVAQTTITGCVLQRYHKLAQRAGWNGSESDLFADVATTMAAQDLTI